MYYWDYYRGVYSCVFPGERGWSRIKLLRMKIKWGKKGGREGEGEGKKGKRMEEREGNGRKRDWEGEARGKRRKREEGRGKGSEREENRKGKGKNEGIRNGEGDEAKFGVRKNFFLKNGREEIEDIGIFIYKLYLSRI